MSDTIPGAKYSKQKSRKGYSTIQALDPHDGGRWDVLLGDDKMDWIAKQGRGACLELGDTVRWSLLNTRRLFRGVRDDDRDIDDDGWLCYVCKPSHAYDWKRHERVAPWQGQVFLVYVTDERIIYHWFWVACDPEDDNLPIRYADRFKVSVF